MRYHVNTADETRTLGQLLGETGLPGDVLWLHGELGAGKTEMTKGFAIGVQARDMVSSPSFALIHEYGGGRLPLYHIDLYRLAADAAMDLGLEEYLESEGVTVIEWGERLPERYFPDGLDVELTYLDTSDARQITFSPRGVRGKAWLARFLAKS